jgi:hypothetical protein
MGFPRPETMGDQTGSADECICSVEIEPMDLNIQLRMLYLPLDTQVCVQYTPECSACFTAGAAALRTVLWLAVVADDCPSALLT